MKNPETLIQNEIQAWCKDNHILCLRVNASASLAGWPDLIAFVDDIAVPLEVKTETGKATQLQERLLNNFVFGGVVRSLEEAIGAIEHAYKFQPVLIKRLKEINDKVWKYDELCK